MSASIRIKRGFAANLPASAEVGDLLATTVTKVRYMGQGTGQPLLNMSGSGGGGGGLNVVRYAVGGAGNGSYVLATGSVGDVTLSITGPAATLTAANGAKIISACIHFSTVNMAGVTNATV